MRLNQVTVGSTDIARSEAFYSNVGLRLIVRDEHYLRFECPDGSSTFSVELMPSVAPGGVTVYFECSDRSDLDAVYSRLVASGVSFDSPPTDMPWLWREARLSDPDGHSLCLFWAGEARRNPPWRLS